MYIHLPGCEQLRPHPGFRHLKYGFSYILPARIAEFVAQPLLRSLPVGLSHRHLSPACTRQSEQALPPVFPPPRLNPAMFPQQPQRSRQSRTVHGKASAQPLLISLSHRSQCSEQTELRDLKACPSQFLVVNPRYDPAEAAKVLTRAWQVKKCICRSLSQRFCPHSMCIYICCSLASNEDLLRY
jgi:hypothetical protein